MQTYEGRLFAPSTHGSLLAIVHQSILTIVSTSPAHPTPPPPSFSDTAFLSQCKLIRWYRPPAPSGSSHASPARLLLASDTVLHVLDAHDPSYHASIAHPFAPTSRLAHASLLSPHEVLAIPDLAPRATLWDLRSGRGVEIRDPKTLGRRGGAAAASAFAVRPRSGHVAVLTRLAGRDIVVVLGPPGKREVEASFELAVADARGLRWSAEGRWLAAWEAASGGAAVALYTPDGQLFKVWRDEGGAEGVSLGIERCEWCGERLCVGLGDGRVVVLAGRALSPSAVLQFPNPITALASSASAYEEQISSTDSARSYTLATLPLAPPALHPTPKESPANAHGILHLVPSPDGKHLAVVPANAPTTAWITLLEPNACTVAVLVHHAPIKALEWRLESPHPLLIQCSVAPSSTESAASHFPIYICLPSVQASPLILSVSRPQSVTSFKSSGAGSLPAVSATWLPNVSHQDSAMRLLISAPGACAIFTVEDDTNGGTFAFEPAALDGVQVGRGEQGALRSSRENDTVDALALNRGYMHASEAGVDDTFANLKRPR